ncbi:hypothetical protein [Candidatus Sororendozoicomonas aggregata]|uniref:hypothetical protein n=1 Tax=Candidatus Sororendozoicomonas aggregata TaxID=3073239 RepID=UPI002ED10661
MDAISFTNGLSGISTLSNTLINKDFPKNKSSFKPSGDNVIAYTWRALEFDRTFEHREMRFALNLLDMQEALSPEEHSTMMMRALAEFTRSEKEGPEITEALKVLKESKALQDSLYMSRHVLHAG